MYGKLWNFVNQYIDKEHALAVYLPILIVGWTIIGTVIYREKESYQLR